MIHRKMLRCILCVLFYYVNIQLESDDQATVRCALFVLSTILICDCVMHVNASFKIRSGHCFHLVTNFFSSIF